MRIKRSTLSGLPRGPAPGQISPRAARIRQTLQDGLYTVDLDRLAGSVIASVTRPEPAGVDDSTEREPAADFAAGSRG